MTAGGAPARLRGALFAGAAAGTVAVLMAVGHDRHAPYHFEVRCRSSIGGYTRLYYDAGAGFRDADSRQTWLDGGNQPLLVRLPVPVGTYRSLRFDLLDRACRMTIADARLVDPAGRVVRRFPPACFAPLHQIASLTPRGGVLDVETTGDADDPGLSIRLDDLLLLDPLGARVAALAHGAPPKSHAGRRAWRRAVAARYGPAGAAGALAGWAAFLLLGWALRRVRDRARVLLRRRPFGAVAVAGLLAACASCFPVILFGKSFVSPNNTKTGIAMLYQTAPTVPGFDVTETEDSNGSDLGAMMWEFVPYARVQYRALMKDGELPLWNRFNGCGSVLWAQGISMLGDPLQLPVILSGGAAWAWDAKFVAAKVLFAAGVGLMVRLAVGDGLAAVLLACSAPYLGFFCFRFNHTAFFSLCYAPWIVCAWLGVIHARSRRSLAWCVAGLTLANWMELHSGTAKEGFMLLAGLNLWGWIALLGDPATVALPRGRKAVVAAAAQTLFLPLAAPTWAAFLEALAKAHTEYEVPIATQQPPGLLIGAFDDIFFRQFRGGEAATLPSANFFVLTGVLFALARVAILRRASFFTATCLSALLPFSLAFGVVPAGWIVRVPLLAHVYHVDNTFICALLVHLLALAGYGVRECTRPSSPRFWLGAYWRAQFLCAALLAAYAATAWHIAKSAFFWADAAVLTCAAAAVPWTLRSPARGRSRPARRWLAFAGLFAALHWRHGMYLRAPFNAYVMNPQARADLAASAPSLDFIRTSLREPARVVGQDDIFFPGYGGVAGLEGLGGPDALANRRYHELLAAAGLLRGWRFTITTGLLAAQRPLFDMLNTKYYLMSLGWKDGRRAGLRREADLDLSVYASPTAWPRAFLAEAAAPYRTLPELLRRVARSGGRPFAAVQQDDWTGLPPWLRRGSGQPAVAATGYRLTNTTTSFTLDAPRRGIAVLTECEMPGDFVAKVDGRPAAIIRVNHAFKGVIIGRPGRHAVTFTYRPAHWPLLLLASAAGLALLVAGGLWLRR